MSDYVIETRGLTRYFGQKPAVQALDLKVPRGSVLGFLGRNGSGKSTTIRMLLGLLVPTRGQALVLGHDATRLPPEVRARIGYMAESHPVIPWMRVGRHGRFQSTFYPSWDERIFRGVLDHFRIDPKARAGDLSRGQRAGLALALVLATQPELLILDDPALGLDPVARRALVEAMIFVTRRRDRTILFSSHMLSDVERVADHIAILDRSILRCAAPVEVFRQHVRRLVLSFPRAVAPPALPPIPGLLRSVRTENELRLTLTSADHEAEAALEKLGAATIHEEPISLEDAFLDYLDERGEQKSLLNTPGELS